jgi:hypothetical protein
VKLLKTSTIAVCGALFLAGCETTPQEPVEPGALVCPEPEPVECPVCEVTQCPVVDVEPPAPVQCEPVVPQACPEPSLDTRFPVIGEKEWALLEPSDFIYEARIDTGAETSSIHAVDIQLVEKDGKRWVRFKLPNPATDEMVPLERPLHRRVMIKQTASEDLERRYVVRMWVTLGETRVWLDVSLSDREDFEFPVLIGRNMLMDNFAVDVSKHYVLPKPVPGKNKKNGR